MYLKRSTRLCWLMFGLGLLVPIFSLEANEVHQPGQDRVSAEVVEILDQELEPIDAASGLQRITQTLVVQILEGERKGEEVVVENEISEMKVGDRFFLGIFQDVGGNEFYIVGDPDRRWVLITLLVLFVAAVLAFGFWKGIRALISLTISFSIIIWLLIPALLAGHSPVLATIIFASLILFLAMYITHGVNRITHAAFLGTAVTIAAVSLLAHWAVYMARLSGFHTHEAAYLYLDTGGTLDMSGLLLGAMIIGVLGVLDDISITQAATVREMAAAAPDLSRMEVFQRTLSVGKEHVVSLVNTLALAYAGVALPLLLLFASPAQPVSHILNMEIFSVEIIRTLIGSIGLIMAVPVTTAFAVWLALKPDPNEDPAKLPHSHHHH